MFNFTKKKKNNKKERQTGLMISPAPTVAFDISEPFFHSGNTDNQDPLIISYGTRDGKYDALSKRLLESCENAGHYCSFETIPDCGRQNACLFKPTFIKMKLLMYGRPVIWIDADAVLNDALRLPAGEWDIASLKNDRSDDINEKAVISIAFRPTVAALRFIEYWEQLCSAFWLQPGLDHRRFNYARAALEGRYSEVELHPVVEGKLVRDVGASKEKAF